MSDSTDATFDDRRHRALARGARGRRLLGRVVRARAGSSGRCSSRRSRRRAGAVELVKVDVDANPRVALRYRVQGIPAVKAFKDGRLVDEFTGALPRAAVDSFLRGLLPSEADRLAALGDEASLRRALELQPNHPAARAALVRLESAGDPVLAPALDALAQGETERGLELLLQALQDAGDDLRERIRQLMVGVFTELGQDDPLASKYRRRLASALY